MLIFLLACLPSMSSTDDSLAFQEAQDRCHLPKAETLELEVTSVDCQRELGSDWVQCTSFPTKLQGRAFRTTYLDNKCYILNP